MTSQGDLNVKIYKNSNILKQIKEPIALNQNDWKNYIKVLKSVQKNVNEFLTELVDQEKNIGHASIENNEDQEVNDDSENDEELPLKRKSQELDYKTRKKKKI